MKFTIVKWHPIWQAAIDHFDINNNKEEKELKKLEERRSILERVINGSLKLNKVTLGIKAHMCARSSPA